MKKTIVAYVFLNADNLKWDQQQQQDLLYKTPKYICTIR